MLFSSQKLSTNVTPLCLQHPSAILIWLILTCFSSLSFNTPPSKKPYMVLSYTCSSLPCGAFQFPVSFSLNCQLYHGGNSANLANVDKPAQKHSAWLRMQPLILHCTGNTLLTCKHAQDALGSEKSMFPHRIYGIISFCREKCPLKRNLKG